jgi:hypothetical protein
MRTYLKTAQMKREREVAQTAISIVRNERVIIMIHDFFRWNFSIFIGLEFTIFWVVRCTQFVFANIKTNDPIKNIQMPSSFNIFANRHEKSGINQECFSCRKSDLTA